jgi:hypothetical protein
MRSAREGRCGVGAALRETQDAARGVALAFNVARMRADLGRSADEIELAGRKTPKKDTFDEWSAHSMSRLPMRPLCVSRKPSRSTLQGNAAIEYWSLMVD